MKRYFHTIDSRMVRALRPVAVATILGVLSLNTNAQTAGQAAGGPPSGNTSAVAMSTQADVDAYWTPQRMLSARPIVLTARAGQVPQAAPDAGTPTMRVEGSAPRATLPAHESKTLVPAPFLEDLAREATASAGAEPNATSTAGAYFTTGRVFPDAAASTYPYLTAGKLFFSDPRTGGNFVCSASVLRQRIVVTAGHCITKPSTSSSQRYFYTKFAFAPAYTNGVAPKGFWSVSVAWITNAWYYSTGAVPHAQDVGMLVMADKSGQRIGSVTGFLGYYTGQLGRNHLTMLGYPCNLDSCQRMEVNNAFTYADGGNNTFIYGSAMRGGSSGGPWIQDFGVNPSSSPVVSLGNNYLVAVTSYGPVSTTPKYQGASNLDSRFISLLNSACGAATTKNCVW